MKRICIQLTVGLLMLGAARLAAQTNVVAERVITSTSKMTASNSTPMAMTTTNSRMAVIVSTNAVGSNSPAATASTNEAPVKLDSQYFRLVVDRNIFDQTRRRRIVRDTNIVATPPAKIDSFTLTGVGLDDNQGAAMFDSTSSLFRGTLKAGESIAGYRIAEIAPDLESIKLAAASNQVVTLRVGMQMRRRNNGPWLLASRSETFTAPPTEADAEKTDTNTGTAPATGGSMDDIMKRLMERRAKE